jgi:hypothetical protein
MDDGIQAESPFPLRERHYQDDYTAIRKESGGLRGWGWLLIVAGVVCFCGVGALLLGVLLLGGLWLQGAEMAPAARPPVIAPVEQPTRQVQSERP